MSEVTDYRVTPYWLMVCCTTDRNKQNVINLAKFIVAKLGSKFSYYFMNI